MDSELIELLAPVIKHWKEKNKFGDEPMDSDDVLGAVGGPIQPRGGGP